MLETSTNTHRLDAILEANEFIRLIDDMAFLIKLNALNALFLAMRSGEQLRGYIVVTDEFNRFTSELMQFVDKLRGEIYKIVYSISSEIKQSNVLRQYRKIDPAQDYYDSIQFLIGNHEFKINEMEKEIMDNLKTIQRLIMRNEKLILRGGVLAMQAKIEGAYSVSSREVFRDVADSFQAHIQKIHNSLNELKNMVASKKIISG